MSEKNDNRNFGARIEDLCERACRTYTPCYTSFLTPEESVEAKRLASGFPDLFVLAFGGYGNAERVILGFFPSDIYLPPEECCRSDERYRQYEADSGLAFLKIAGSGFSNFDHRDVLGSVMATGIKRETVGDIYVAEGRCDFLVTREVLPYLLQNFLSAGRTKLHVEQIALTDVSVPEQKIKMVRDTVPSLRLDGIVSSGFSISRGKAADYISAGKCELNYTPCVKGDKQTTEGDVITVRGLGKIRLDTIGSNTKKGRIGVEITRFL